MRDLKSSHSELHYCAKLTKQAVIDLRLGCLQIEDAVNKYGVALITAKQAKDGTTWKHLNNTAEPY